MFRLGCKAPSFGGSGKCKPASGRKPQKDKRAQAESLIILPKVQKNSPRPRITAIQAIILHTFGVQVGVCLKYCKA